MVKQSPQLDDWRGLNELRIDVERTLSRNCRDSNELDDLVQETLLRAASFRRGLTDSSRLRSWVLRIAWNVMRDHVRQERRLRHVDFTEELILRLEAAERRECETPGNDDVHIGGEPYAGEDVLGLLRALLMDMPEEEQQLYATYYTEGLACEPAAQKLEVSTQTIKMRLFRMRKKLRRSLNKQAGLLLTPCHQRLEVIA